MEANLVIFEVPPPCWNSRVRMAKITPRMEPNGFFPSKNGRHKSTKWKDFPPSLGLFFGAFPLGNLGCIAPKEKGHICMVNFVYEKIATSQTELQAQNHHSRLLDFFRWTLLPMLACSIIGGSGAQLQTGNAPSLVSKEASLTQRSKKKVDSYISWSGHVYPSIKHGNP